MKKIFLTLLCLPIIGLGQYSNYYNIDHNINKNVNVSGTVNKNVNVRGTINKNVNVRSTVSTIDYGALAQANAQREANRLSQQRIAIEQAQYRDAKGRNDAIMDANRAIEIAEDPMKAHTYGYRNTIKYNYKNQGMGSLKTLHGFLSYEETFIVPHKSLFENVGAGRWENISFDGITTEVIFKIAYHNYRNLPYLDFEQGKKYSERFNVLKEYYLNHQLPKKRNYKKDKDAYNVDLNRYWQVCDSLDNYGFALTPKSQSKMYHLKEKSMFLGNDNDSAFCHKKEVVKRTVYGNKGFRYTLIWEDDYEICITDNYLSLYNGTYYSSKVRYKADKSSGLTFEDLEGRRFYLSKFIDKTIATRIIRNTVYESEDKYKPKRMSFSNSEGYQKAYNIWQKRVNN